jgi:hypothetical protein
MDSKKQPVIIVDNGRKSRLGPLDAYCVMCAAGFGLGTAGGATAGAFLGGAIGLTAVATSPIILGYGMIRAVRLALRPVEDNYSVIKVARKLLRK